MIGHYLSSNNEMCYSSKIQTFSPTKHTCSYCHKPRKTSSVWLVFDRTELTSLEVQDISSTHHATGSVLGQSVSNPLNLVGKICTLGWPKNHWVTPENTSQCIIDAKWALLLPKHIKTWVYRTTQVACDYQDCWEIFCYMAECLNPLSVVIFSETPVPVWVDSSEHLSSSNRNHVTNPHIVTLMSLAVHKAHKGLGACCDAWVVDAGQLFHAKFLWNSDGVLHCRV